MKNLRNIVIGLLLAIGVAAAGTKGLQAGLTYVREFDGTNGINILAPGTTPSTANALLTSGTYYTVSSLTVPNSSSSSTYDVGTYRMAAVQVNAMGTGGNLAFQQSNDNTNWVAIYGVANTLSSTLQSNTTSTGTLFSFQLTCRYFRLSNTNTSGTTTVGLSFTSSPTQSLYTQPSSAFASNNTSAGTSIYSNTSLGNTVVAVKSSGGNVYGYHFYNPNTTVEYIQVFNLASGSVVLGTTTPTWTIGIPPTSAITIDMPTPISHSAAISIAATSTPTTNAAPTTNLTGYVKYQ